MKLDVLFLITEYNPFHNGHLFHIKKSRKLTGCEHVIAIMSGNFVQRGEPAVLDKWARTEAALKNGADMVIELPVYYATASAAYFAEGAVCLADRTGLGGSLCFGSECGDIELIKKAARTISTEDGAYRAALKTRLEAGSSFPAAREYAAASVNAGIEPLLREPNNILAVEYVKVLMKYNSVITPYTIKRISAHHHSAQIRRISSAGAIRKSLRVHSPEYVRAAMPESAYEILCSESEKGAAHADIELLSSIFHYLLKTRPEDELHGIMDMVEGLENRMVKTTATHRDIRGVLSSLKTKRYTYTMLSRAVLHLILGITKRDFQHFQAAGGPQYIRVLGFNREKSYLLKAIENLASLPLLMNIKNAGRILGAPGMKMLEKEIETTDIYNLSRPGVCYLDKGHEFRRPIVIL